MSSLPVFLPSLFLRNLYKPTIPFSPKLIRVKVGKELTEGDTSKNTVLYAEGEGKYYIDRATHYLIKGIYGIPRLY